MKIGIIISLLLIAIIKPALAEQSLMRLFYSPSERAEIDSNKNNSELTDNKPNTVQQNTDRVEIKGYVLRDGMSDVIWVNDKNSLKSRKLLPDVKVNKVQKKGMVSIKVNGERTVKLKPGQVITRSESRIQERYEIQK